MFFLKAESKRVKGHISELQLFCIIDGINFDFALREAEKVTSVFYRRHIIKSLQEVVVGVSAHEHKVLQTLHNAFLNKLEEDVVAALVGLLVSHAGLLKQVDVNEATGQLSHVVEVDPDELTEPGRVVVPDGLGIAIGFENWVGVDNPILQVGFFLLWRLAILLLLSLRSSKDGKVGDDLLRVLGLSGPGLSSDLEG